jgi:hypothetical protein
MILTMMKGRGDEWVIIGIGSDIAASLVENYSFDAM